MAGLASSTGGQCTHLPLTPYTVSGGGDGWREDGGSYLPACQTLPVFSFLLAPKLAMGRGLSRAEEKRRHDGGRDKAWRRRRGGRQEKANGVVAHGKKACHLMCKEDKKNGNDKAIKQASGGWKTSYNH